MDEESRTEIKLKVKRPESLKDQNIAQLTRAIKLRNQYFDELNDRARKLMEKSIFAAYQDCVESGVKDQATQIIEEKLPEFLQKVTPPEKPKDAPKQNLAPTQEGSLGSVVLEEE